MVGGRGSSASAPDASSRQGARYQHVVDFVNLDRELGRFTTSQPCAAFRNHCAPVFCAEHKHLIPIIVCTLSQLYLLIKGSTVISTLQVRAAAASQQCGAGHHEMYQSRCRTCGVFVLQTTEPANPTATTSRIATTSTIATTPTIATPDCRQNPIEIGDAAAAA